MALKDLASFPNSRIKPRPATQAEVPYRRLACGDGEIGGTVLPDGGIVTVNGNILLLPHDDNRTFAFIRNLDPVHILYWTMTDSSRALLDKGVGADYWQPLLPHEGADIESKEDIYIRSDGAGAAGRLTCSGREGEG